MIKLLHTDCGGNLAIDVNIQNIYGSIRAGINQDNIVAKFHGLIGAGVTVQGTRFICLRCDKDVDEKEVGITCTHTGELKPFNEFFLLRCKQKTGKRSKSHIIHKDYVKPFTDDHERGGYKVEKIQPKLTLDLEVKHG